MNKKKFLVIILLIGVFSYLWVGLKGEQPAEDMEVVIGFGADQEKKGKEITYIAPSSIYTFEEGEKVSSSIREGKGITPARTRENRQITSNKRYILGLEKVYIIGEAIADYGIQNTIEIFFRNSYTNDNGYMAVCNGKPKDILKLKIIGYPSSSDYIQGMIKNAKYYNFFSSNYKISDVFLSIAAEGKNVNLPYIDLVNNELKINGLSVFKKYKMVGKLDIDDARILNMLSETDGRGIITVRANSNDYLDYYAKVKRHVNVYKNGDQYKYIIDLKFTGDIVSDTLYGKDEINNKINNEIKKEIEESIKKSSYYLIDKLKKEYKVDSLQLGQYAAAKYGRGKEIDWDEVFTKAEIEVKAKVQIDRRGRGDYLLKK
ncbi:Ger(x)C family spore germination protein [Clostridium scatologenes]|uniref:GerKC4 n=1 Tax=Clostridium scatologenes TaxID=1548 RepID=A0A0E3M887_CLOSL|nr:Ger(x)C family spore germination protein [Clostridium scatologenes]AKA68028.1 GerKC4 [Clostridium scatologenes]